MSDRRRKRAKYYQGGSNNNGKRSKNEFSLQRGMHGYLISCGEKRESFAVKDAYSILNQYFTEQSDQATSSTCQPEVTEDPPKSDAEDVDIATELEKECGELKSDVTDGVRSQRRFQAMKTSVKNLAFISDRNAISAEEMMSFGEKLLNEVAETRNGKSRFIMRFVPVLETCKAEMPEMTSLLETLLPPLFQSSEAISYCVVFKARHNDTVRRIDVIDLIGAIIQRANAASRANLASADLTVLVEVMSKVCCVSVVRQFAKLRRYNLQELTINGVCDLTVKPRKEKETLDLNQIVEEETVT